LDTYFDAPLLLLEHVLDPSKHLAGLMTKRAASSFNLVAIFWTLANRWGLPTGGDGDAHQHSRAVGETTRALLMYLQPNGQAALHKQYPEQDGSITAIARWSSCIRHLDTALPEVARRLLSICPHAADLERVWSLMGLSDTDSRSRLHPDKLTAMATISLRLREEVTSNKVRRPTISPGSYMESVVSRRSVALDLLMGVDDRFGSDEDSGGDRDGDGVDGGDGAPSSGAGAVGAVEELTEEEDDAFPELLATATAVEQELVDEAAM